MILYDLISKFQIGLKSLLSQVLSEPEFYGDLVYKLKKIVGSNIFSAQFIKIISHYKKIGYKINVLQQTVLSFNFTNTLHRTVQTHFIHFFYAFIPSNTL